MKTIPPQRDWARPAGNDSETTTPLHYPCLTAGQLSREAISLYHWSNLEISLLHLLYRSVFAGSTRVRGSIDEDVDLAAARSL